ncbi:Noelin-3, partial [Nibea albiflora]
FQFVLLVGDSHLRALVDGFVAMPEGTAVLWLHVHPWGDCSAPEDRASWLLWFLASLMRALSCCPQQQPHTACRGWRTRLADFRRPGEICNAAVVQRCGAGLSALDSVLQRRNRGCCAWLTTVCCVEAGHPERQRWYADPCVPSVAGSRQTACRARARVTCVGRAPPARTVPGVATQVVVERSRATATAGSQPRWMDTDVEGGFRGNTYSAVSTPVMDEV